MSHPSTEKIFHLVKIRESEREKQQIRSISSTVIARGAECRVTHRPLQLPATHAGRNVNLWCRHAAEPRMRDVLSRHPVFFVLVVRIRYCAVCANIACTEQATALCSETIRKAFDKKKLQLTLRLGLKMYDAITVFFIFFFGLEGAFFI